MLRRALLAAVLAAGFAAPCSAITIPKTLGSHHGVSTINALTTVTNDCPVGSLIVVFTDYTTITDTLSSVTDNAGNTYQTPIDNIVGTGIGIGIAYAKNTTVDLPIGGIITATFAGSVTSGLAAECVTKAHLSSPLDVHNQSSTGLAATSATTVNTGTLTNADEAIIGVLASAVTNASPVCGGSYAVMGVLQNTPSIFLCAQIVSSVSSVAFSPSWGTTANYVSDVVSFQGPSVTAPSLLPMGVGP